MIFRRPIPLAQPSRAASLAWRSAGLFFLFPGAVALLKPGLPLTVRLLAATGCTLGLFLLTKRRWSRSMRSFGLGLPVAAACNLVALNTLSGGQAFQTWEIVLWYGAGIMWVGLTQTVQSLWLAPLLVGTFALTSSEPFGPTTLYAALLTIAVMMTIAQLVAHEMARGRRAYARVRRSVRVMTAVARTGKESPLSRPSEIHHATSSTALELGFAGAGVALLIFSRRKWEWRSFSGEAVSEGLRQRLPDLLFRVAEQARGERVTAGGRELLLLPLLRVGDTAYVMAAHAPPPIEDEQLHALELLTAQTARGLEILRMAFYDELTDLPNRSLFRDRLAEHLERARSDAQYSFGLLYLDVDRFKAINDLHGHAIGDCFLAELASRLQRGVRGLDYVSHRDTPTSSRIGGDEFAVLLPQLASPRHATMLAERLHGILSRPYFVDGRELVSSPSIGVVLSDGRYNDPSEMMRDADTAMYRAKRSDQVQWAVFDSAMRDSIDRSLELERALTHAVDRGEVYLQYQPIVETASGNPVGFEALMRWHHPELGLISPTEFIPLAESTGAIRDLSRWAFEQATRELAGWTRAWRQTPPLYVSVNLSRKQMGDPRLPDQLRALLRARGLAAEQLVVEITEGMALLDLNETRRFLGELRELGIRLALDDFGTGFSSLSCLHELPVQILKLDREFVVAAQKEERALGAVDGAVKMAHAMGLQVVAEGVEEPEQRALMEQVRCDLIQGYLFAAPLEAASVTAWLAEHAPLEADLDP